MKRILTTIRDGLVDGFRWIANAAYGVEALAIAAGLLIYLVSS